MFGLNILYILFSGILFSFGCLFFSSDLIIHKIKSWKSQKLYYQSKVYHDPLLDNVSGLLDEGVQKARIAHLLNPADENISINYLRLQMRTSPVIAIRRWSKMLENKKNLKSRTELFDESFKILNDAKYSREEKKGVGHIANREADILLSSPEWSSKKENKLKYIELLAQLGKQEMSKRKVIELLEDHPDYADGIFLLTRLCIHLEDDTRLTELGSKLASLASRQNLTGINAIRHLTLLHLMKPLSLGSLDKCIKLLSINPKSTQIDYMRIYAIKYSQLKTDQKKDALIAECASLFDLENLKELLVFNRWLVRLGEYRSILLYIPVHKARVNEELFKLRTAALANVGDFEKIHTEIAQAQLIPSKWKIILESRAYTLLGNYNDAIKSLDRLIPILENDPREFENVCEYLEVTGYIEGLCHILEYFSNKPTHARFSLTKLIQHRAGSADAISLITWLEKLAQISPSSTSLNLAITYVKLLDPSLVSPSVELNVLIEEAKKHVNETDLPQAKISLALAHLRNNSPDKSLVALGNEKDWRIWIQSRPAWLFLASQVFRLNHDSEKALLLQRNINFENMDFAEKQTLRLLFPKEFGI